MVSGHTLKQKISSASEIIAKSKYLVAFTGAGISVESGIPPFRGENGLWSKYDPDCLNLSNYYEYPDESWKIIKEIFYDFFGKAKPNEAHFGLAKLESAGLLKYIITQNIDNLHQDAGSKNVLEFHGNSRTFICSDCNQIFNRDDIDLDNNVPECINCKGLLKPNFIFFGEAIPEPAGTSSFEEAGKSDVLLVIGSTGEVLPACNIPYFAKRKGTLIIEINPEKSSFTDTITDIFLQGKAGIVMSLLMESLKDKLSPSKL